MKKQITNLALTALTISSSSVIAQQTTTKQTIEFKENKGQVCDQNYNPRPDVLYSGNANGLNFHLTQSGISYQLKQVKNWKESDEERTKLKSKTPDLFSIYRIDVKWINANHMAIIEKGLANQDVDNYYLQQCPNGALGVKSYKDIVYKEIYKGIDLKWYEKNYELEYDYIVKPFADYTQIKFEINGAEKLSLNSKGELIIKTPFGDIMEKAPVAYQNGQKIKAQWNLKNNMVSFKVANYDHSLPLIIDPVVRIWGTFYGGNLGGTEFGNCVASNSSTGDSYTTGRTDGSTGTNIATSGAHQTLFGGASDAYLVKFNSLGVRQWATFYGGSVSDEGTSCAFDNATTDIYLSGITSSTLGIASAAAHQTVLAGGQDGFLARFNSTTGVRTWGTYYGGANTDFISSCTTDPTGNIFITGYTNSSLINEIATPSAFQTTINPSGTHGFLVKFNNAGVRQWGTYCNTDSPLEQMMSCKSDPSGDIYVAGQILAPFTASLLTTPGTHQPTSAGNDEAILLKFSTTGNRLWGTLYGGSGADYGRACATDLFGQVYLIGTTASTNSISTVGAYQTAPASGTDCFVAKFNSLGIRQWGTYFGDVTSETLNGACSDIAGNVYLCGATIGTNSGVFSSPGSHQYTNNGASDAFIAKFSGVGVFQWSSYYGGSTTDAGKMCAVSGSTVFLCGNTMSTGTDIATSGSHQPNNVGGWDAFLVAFNDCAGLPLSVTGNTNLCVGQTSTLTVVGTGLTSYTWNPGPNTSTNNIAPTVTTNYSISVGTATSICKYNFVKTVSVSPNPTVNVTSSSATICAGDSPTLAASGATTYSWNTTSTSSSITPTPTATTTYTVVGSNGGICSNTKTISILVNALPSVSVSATATNICVSGNTIGLIGSPSGGSYSGAAVTGSVFTPPSTAGTYSVSYSYTNATTTCSNSATDIITVNLCTGIENLNQKNNGFYVFPNPSNGKIAVEIEDNSRLQILNVLGQLIIEIDLQMGKNEINLNELANGVYYFTISQGELSITKKVIKN